MKILKNFNIRKFRLLSCPCGSTRIQRFNNINGAGEIEHGYWYMCKDCSSKVDINKYTNHITPMKNAIAYNHSGVHYLTTTRLFFGMSRIEFFEGDTVCLKMQSSNFYENVKISKIYSNELHLYQDVLKSYIVNYSDIREMWKVS